LFVFVSDVDGIRTEGADGIRTLELTGTRMDGERVGLDVGIFVGGLDDGSGTGATGTGATVIGATGAGAFVVTDIGDVVTVGAVGAVTVGDVVLLLLLLLRQHFDVIDTSFCIVVHNSFNNTGRVLTSIRSAQLIGCYYISLLLLL
jgi:hypothetical protein